VGALLVEVGVGVCQVEEKGRRKNRRKMGQDLRRMRAVAGSSMPRVGALLRAQGVGSKIYDECALWRAAAARILLCALLQHLHSTEASTLPT
jgi:hypothetical protein